MNNKNNSFLEDIVKESETLSEEEEKQKETKEEKPTKAPTSSQPLFLEQVLTTYLSEERIREKLGEINIEQKEVVNELIVDQQKIDDYDRLEVKDLPENWKEQLNLIPQLEKNQEKHQTKDLKPQDYDQIRNELVEWKQTFNYRTPEEITQQIKELEKRPAINQTTWEEYQIRKSPGEFQEVTNKLKAWEDAFANQTPNEVENERIVLLEKEKELKKWEENFPKQTFKEVKDQLEQLNQRPSISEQEWSNKQEEVQRLNNELEQVNNSLKEWEKSFSNRNSSEVQKEIKNLEKEWSKRNQEYNQAVKELEEWRRVLGSEKPQEIKEKIHELSQRPNIPIKEQQWWDDYSGRKSREQDEQEKQIWQQNKQKINEYETEIKSLLEISDLSAWKLEVTKLKNAKEGLEKKIKLVMGLNDSEPISDDWHNQAVSRQQIKILQNEIEQEKSKLKEWTSEFPHQTPSQINQERKNIKKLEQNLQEWKGKFENKNAKELEKEIKNKNTEISILKQQVTELGGTAGANPSERLIESKLKEVIVVEDWNLGYLTQVLKKFLEWRELGNTEQRKAVNKYWLVIQRNLEYLKTRERQVNRKYGG